MKSDRLFIYSPSLLSLTAGQTVGCCPWWLHLSLLTASQSVILRFDQKIGVEM